MNDIVHELDMGLVQIILYNFCERMTNGCNVPVVFLKLGIAREYARLFKESCNRHDVCYVCVSTRQVLIKNQCTNYN